jgi:hypothetical protein
MLRDEALSLSREAAMVIGEMENPHAQSLLFFDCQLLTNHGS